MLLIDTREPEHIQELLAGYLYNLYRLMWWVIGLSIWLREGRPQWSYVDDKRPDTLQHDGWGVRFEVLGSLLTQGWTAGAGSYLGVKDTLRYVIYRQP